MYFFAPIRTTQACLILVTVVTIFSSNWNSPVLAQSEFEFKVEDKSMGHSVVALSDSPNLVTVTNKNECYKKRGILNWLKNDIPASNILYKKSNKPYFSN